MIIINYFRLEGKVAVITGAASGISEAAARLFSRHGAKAVIADIQDDLAHKVCKELDPTSTTFVHCDVTKEEDLENAVNIAVDKYGKLEIMYNNVGIMGAVKSNILDKEIRIRKSHQYQPCRYEIIALFISTLLIDPDFAPCNISH
ncbi:momilactone a synthase [Nicotiana attenuata]|uniref:Momilactone a synthase n=1 Tax=Nicotiana attenuata TaxID=49451 RepID=A0A1J6KZU8_NICAT|nr:momilactone a synthase [Nicotiana attenuata]